MKYSPSKYKASTILYIISFLISIVIVRGFLSNLPNSTFKAVIVILLLLSVFSFVCILYDRHQAYKEAKARYFSETFQFSSLAGTEYASFVQRFRMFLKSYSVSDPLLFVSKCIETGMDKYISFANTHPAFSKNLRSFDPTYSYLDPSTNVMKYNGMEASIEYNSERDIFIGSVLNAGNLMHFTGSSTSELQSEFHKTVDNYYAHWDRVRDELDSSSNCHP